MSAQLNTIHTGMGGIPHQKGTAFRVWAPHASEVYIKGDFNNWSDTANPMTLEDNGYWYTDIPGAKVDHEYKYLIMNGPNSYERIDPYAREVTNSIGNSIIVNPKSNLIQQSYHTPSWNEMVIYELHIGTFNDEPGGHPGDIQKTIKKLKYLKDLGINVIELMPIGEFPQDFSWGYNPAHIYAIEQAYGGPDALKELINKAHAHDIAVIMDVVYNHFGPSDLDLWQFDGWEEDNKGGIYFYNDWRGNTNWGPRPDYGRSEVCQYIRDNVFMWLEEFGFDGLRWDATAYIRNVYGNDADQAHDIPEGWWLMQRINSEIDARTPGKISIAEDLRNNDWITKETHFGGSGFDSQWDAGFVHPVREAIICSDDSDRNMYEVRDAIYHRYNGDAFDRVIYTESHDEVANGKARVPYEIWPQKPGSWFSKKRSSLGAALVFTSPGIPMIFQGQEFLEDEWFHDKDPLDWNKQERYKGLVTMYRDLIRLRRNWHNNTRGLRGQQVNVHHINDNDKVIAFHRWENGGHGDDVMVIINMANNSYNSYNLGFPQEGIWKVRFNGDWKGYSPDFANQPSYDTTASRGAKDGMPCNGNIGIGAYSCIILSQGD